MKHFGKKLLAAVISVVMAVPVGNVFGTTASAATFLQGDVNGDGILNSVDAAYINNYLLGRGSADGMMLARMDCDNDYAITKNDYNMIMRALSNQTTLSTVTRNALTVPLNESRMYIAYYPDGAPDGFQEYPYTLDSVAPLTSTRSTPQAYDTTNQNIVKLSYGTSNIGTGFIVGNNVIATAAHCVCDIGSGNFKEGIDVTIYNAGGTQPIEILTATEYHIPRSFRAFINESELRRDYDYALIYVEEDLSDYGIWNLGVATDEFMNSGATVSVSGFCTYNGEDRRFVSSGAIQNNNSIYQLESLARSKNGKSGGPIFYTNAGIKTAIGINVWSNKEPDGNGKDSHGVRMTSSVIKFLLDNPYIDRF